MMFSGETHSSIIIRFVGGNTVYVNPDLFEVLQNVIDPLLDGCPLQDFYKEIEYKDNLDYEKRTAWLSVIKEVLDDCNQYGERSSELLSVTLNIIKGIDATKGSLGIWENIKEMITSNIDLLSGWFFSNKKWLCEHEQVIRKDDNYFTQRDGQLQEIMGLRTIEEERWDYIAEACTGTHGVIDWMLNIVALLCICNDYINNKQSFPSSVLLVLPEYGCNGWHWRVGTPFQPRKIPWKPKNYHCDPEWLRADLLATFSEKEGFIRRDNETPDWKGPIAEFKERFCSYPRQLVLALQTPIYIGYESEIWFDFRGRPLRWINQTPYVHATLIVPYDDNKESFIEVYELGLRFLSRYAFEAGSRISVEHSYGTCLTQKAPIGQTKGFGGFRLNKSLDFIHDDPNEREELAFALFREGLSSGSVYYGFHSFYKIIQAAFKDDAPKMKKWLNSEIGNLKWPEIRERIEEIKVNEGYQDIASYLRKQCRNAMNHFKRKPIIDPDNADDHLRISKDLRIVKDLAIAAIKSGLFSS